MNLSAGGRRRRRIRFLILALVVGACADSEPEATASVQSSTAPAATTSTTMTGTTTSPTEAVRAGAVVITDSECSFRQEVDPIPAGVLSLELVNETADVATAHVWGPLADGRTFDDFTTHIDEEIRLATAGEDLMGPAPWFGSLVPPNPEAGLVGGGDTKEVTGTAEPGTFGIVCFRTFDDAGLSIHAHAGPFEVTVGG